MEIWTSNSKPPQTDKYKQLYESLYLYLYILYKGQKCQIQKSYSKTDKIQENRDTNILQSRKRIQHFHSHFLIFTIFYIRLIQQSIKLQQYIYKSESIMSFSTMAYREVDTIVSSWTKKYHYHISLLQSKSNNVKFMVQFSLTKPQKPIPVGTVRVYFTCKCEDQITITFRFQKDSLIHSVDKTIRHIQFEKWIDDMLSKKLLVRSTVFYLGTSYEQSRVKDQRLEKLLEVPKTVQEEQYVWVDPDLLSDQQRSIQILEKTSKSQKKLQADLKSYFRELDSENIGVVTRPQFLKIIQNIGLKLNQKEKQDILKKADKDNTGTVEFETYEKIVSEILQAKIAKGDADASLQFKREQQTFTTILTLINDDVQDIYNSIVDFFKPQQEQEQTGLTNISEVKSCLESINKKQKQQNKNEILNPIQMAEITKILTDKYGYKSIPYRQIHQNILDFKIKTFSSGLINSKMSKLQVFFRQICDKYDDKKFGRIKLKDLIQAIQKSGKIKLTKAQVYLLESILPIDTKTQLSYVQNSKFIAELIKKFYIHSSKKKNPH